MQKTEKDACEKKEMWKMEICLWKARETWKKVKEYIESKADVKDRERCGKQDK